MSREIPEKTIQLARRFAAVPTTTGRIAIDPKCGVCTARLSGGQDNQGFLNTKWIILWW